MKRPSYGNLGDAILRAKIVRGRQFVLKKKAPEKLEPPEPRVARLELPEYYMGRDVPIFLDDAFHLLKEGILKRVGGKSYRGGPTLFCFCLVDDKILLNVFNPIDKAIDKARKAGCRL